MFSVPYNQDIEILKVYEKYKNVIGEVYFSGNTDFIFSARKVKWTEQNDENLITLIKFLKDRNIESNIVMNSINDDRIFDEDGLNNILGYLKELHSIGLNSVTIANPILFKAIKSNIPTINICLSIISNVTNIDQIKQYYEIGLYEVCLPPRSARDKDYILGLKSEFPDLKIKMMCNCFCVPDCIAFIHHHIEISNGSYDKDLKYFEKICNEGDYNILKKNVIFPGEIDYYHYIDIFKISGRQKSTEDIEFILEKYSSGNSGGYDLSRLLDGKNSKRIFNISYINDFRDLDKISNCKYKCIENKCNYCNEILNKYFDVFG